MVTSKDGKRAASIGFGGEAKIWSFANGMWVEEGKIVGAISLRPGQYLNTHGDTTSDKNGAGELWAIALSQDGQHLASTTVDGRINVWDTIVADKPKIREYETKGSFGLCIDLVRPNLDG